MSFNRSGYIGRAPGDSAITISKQYFQPTGVTTDFTFSSGYDPGLIDVYRNGIKLINVLDYAATDGSTISLSTPVGVGSTVQVVAYKAYNVATVKATELDTTVTGSTINLTGDITATNATISALTTTANLSVSAAATVSSALHVGSALTANAAGDVETIGIITATKFAGNATGLTGTPNISAGTIGGSTGTFSGAVNIDDTTDSTSTSTGALIVDGGVGIAKNVYIGAGLSVAGTLTYEDVTNVDSVGLITAKSGVNVSGGQLQVGVAYSVGAAGVVTAKGATFNGDVSLGDNNITNVGEISVDKIKPDGSNWLANMGTDKNIMFSGSIGEIGSVTGFQAVNDAQNANTDFGIRATTIRLATGSAERARIDSSGNLGIGTVSPARRLHLHDQSSDTVQLHITNSTTGVSGSDGVSFALGSDESLIINQRESNKILLKTADTDRVSITSGGDVELSGTAAGVASCTWDASANSLIFKDKSYVKFGDSSDLSIHHEAGSAYMDNGTGDLYMRNSSGQILIRANTDAYISNYAADEHRAAFNNNGSVDLYYDGSSKFSTTNEGIEVTGFTSTTAGMGVTGGLFEGSFIKAGKLSDNKTLGISTANFFYFTTQETTTATPDIRWNDTITLSNKMAVGDVASVTVVTTAAAGGYAANWTIDGNAVTEEWVGGSAPSAGGSDGLDIYSLTIIKTGTGTGDSGFKVIANVSNAT